jgi:RNA polymerase sigma-70 factor (ECF subfamily)
MDDDALIVAVARGDDAALRELFGRHAPWLAARLRAVLPSAEVEDVLQETFLAVWRGARRYQPEGAAGGWLWGIARRQAALWLRRRGPAALLLPAVVAADGRHAADPAEVALSRADLDEAVAALGPAGGPEREVWRLMYVEDRPVAEVAELMGIPEGTVKSRAHRARRLLRAALRRSDPALRGGDPALRGGDPALRGGDPALRSSDSALRGGNPAPHGDSAAEGGAR